MSKIKEQLVQRVINLSELLQDIDDDDEIINKNLKSFIEEIEKDLTYNVSVLGEFSSGKSSMINKVFLGEDILPTKSTPTTAILTIIRYGDNKLLKIHYKDGTSKEFTNNLAEELLKNVATDDENKNPVNIKEVELFWSSDVLKEGVIIIDTPGLNDPEEAREKITMNYLDKTDSIIYLSNSTMPYSRSVKDFIENNIFTKERAEKLFVLLNYWDLVKENEREEVYSYVKNQLQTSIDDITKRENIEKIDTPSLLPISSLNGEGVDAFKQVLWKFLLTIKGDKIINQKYIKFNTIKNNISKILKEKLDLQSKNTEEIDKAISELKEEVTRFENEVNAYKEKIKPNIKIFIDEWEVDIKDYYDDIQEAIINTIQLKINAQKSEEDVKMLIKTTVTRVFSVNEDKLNNISRNLVNKINKFTSEQKEKLKLSHYFTKQDTKKMEKEAKENYLATSLDFKEHNSEQFRIVASSVITAGLLAMITPPLAIVSLAGIAYGEIILQPKLFKKDLDDLMEDIKIQISEITNHHKEKVEDLTNNRIDLILDSISNNITEAYIEKEKLYQSALDNRNKNIDEKVAQTINKKLEEINKI